MKNSTTIKFGETYPEYSLTSFNTGVDVDDMLHKISDTSMEAILECIEDIKNQINSRQELHKNILKDLDETEMELTSFIKSLEIGRRRDETALKDVSTLKAKLIELKEAKSNEKIDCWKDIAKLKEELRTLTREMTERKSRTSMLDSILNEK